MIQGSTVLRFVSLHFVGWWTDGMFLPQFLKHSTRGFGPAGRSKTWWMGKRAIIFRARVSISQVAHEQEISFHITRMLRFVKMFFASDVQYNDTHGTFSHAGCEPRRPDLGWNFQSAMRPCFKQNITYHGLKISLHGSYIIYIYTYTVYVMIFTSDPNEMQ